MILYHATGAAFIIDSSRWGQALDLARRHGWRPAGTLPPPADFEKEPAQPWPAAYDTPLGQEVTRADAACLAQSLARALPAVPDPALRAACEGLALFGSRGGFIVCSSPEDAGGLLELARMLAREPQAFPLPQATGRA